MQCLFTESVKITLSQTLQLTKIDEKQVFADENGTIIQLIISKDKPFIGGIVKETDYLFHLLPNRLILQKIKVFGSSSLITEIMSQRDYQSLIYGLKQQRQKEVTGLNGQSTW